MTRVPSLSTAVCLLGAALLSTPASATDFSESADFGGTTNDVRSIFIDGQGVKWFGTASGIVRYAGA